MSLRANPAPVLATKPLETTTKPIVSSRQRKEDQMHALALELGYFCMPASLYLVDLATKIASSMRHRSASMVYQSVAISLPNFPLELARQTFAFASQDLETPTGTTTWRVDTMAQTTQVFGCIFQDAGTTCSGASKALKTPSEPVIRVVATIMAGAIVSHVEHKRGVERLCAPFRIPQ